MAPKKPFDAGPPSAKIRLKKCANSRENGMSRTTCFYRTQERAGNPTRYVLEKVAENKKSPKNRRFSRWLKNTGIVDREEGNRIETAAPRSCGNAIHGGT